MHPQWHGAGARPGWDGYRGPPWGRWGGPPVLVPAVPLAVLAAVVQLGGSLGRAHAVGVGLGPWAVALLLVGPAAIVLLARVPLAPLAVSIAASVAYAFTGAPLGPVVAAPVAALLLEGFRRRRERWAAMRDARMQREGRARTEERMAMARDLHDALGHSLTLINVQSGAALHTFDRDPENARRALVTVREESHRALEEVRRVLDAVRDPTSAAGRAPAPGLADVSRLVAADPSFAWRSETDGEVRPLPAAVDAAAYRVVQEAMTNVRRHSGARTASVTVRYLDTAVEVSVRDPGDQGAPIEPAGSGTGLVGMRERVVAVGGSLAVGPAPGGGHVVTATFPLDERWMP
jgi:signal transduction histidine kinase